MPNRTARHGLRRLPLLLLALLALAACGRAAPPAEPGDLRWSIAAPRASAPLASDGALYLAAAAGPCAAGECPARIMAVGERDGAPLWELAEPRAASDATLALRGGVLYAALGGDTLSLLAIDAAAGRLLWRADGLAPAPAPVVSDQLVFAADLSADGTRPLRLLDRLSGARLRDPELSGSLIALAGDEASVYALLRDGRLAALDAGSGALRWQAETRYGIDYTSGEPSAVRLRAEAGALILQARPALQLLSEIEVREPRDGALRWASPLQQPDLIPPPIAGGLILLRDVARTDLQAFDLASGQLRWQQTIGKSPTSPVVDGDLVLTSSPSKGVYALDLATGALRWGPRKTDTPLVAAQGIAFGTRATTGVGELALTTAAYAIDASTGERRWIVEGSAGSFGLQPTLAGGQVYLRTATRLYALGS